MTLVVQGPMLVKMRTLDCDSYVVWSTFRPIDDTLGL